MAQQKKRQSRAAEATARRGGSVAGKEETKVKKARSGSVESVGWGSHACCCCHAGICASVRRVGPPPSLHAPYVTLSLMLVSMLTCPRNSEHTTHLQDLEGVQHYQITPIFSFLSYHFWYMKMLSKEWAPSISLDW